MFFDLSIKQWKRHCFLWVTLEFNSSFCYSKTNQKKRAQRVHGLRYPKTKPYMLHELESNYWCSGTNSLASADDSERDTGHSAKQVSFSNTSDIFEKKYFVF